MEIKTGVDSQITVDKIIEVIKQARDKRIEALIGEYGLKSFLEEHYDTIAISAIKEEFLKRDLKELHYSALDLAHYSALIKLAKESGSLAQIQEHILFYEELKTIFNKYGF